MTVAYIVSRFPHASETFIVRELDAVRVTGEVEIELFSLFRAVEGAIHPAAEPWVGRLNPGSGVRGLAAAVWWLLRRPLRLASSVGVICVQYRRSPGLAIRALATLGIACDHARTLQRTHVDHIHAHYATYPALAAWLCWRLVGVGYSFTAHAHDLYVDQSMLGRKLADARFAVTISEFNRRFLAEYAGSARRPVHVVHCGVDPDRYSFRPRGVPEEGPVRALCVGSLQEYKGHEILLRALSASPELARLEVDLVGDGRLRTSLERQARELGIADRVRFAGSLPEGEVRELLDTADLFVLPSVVAADGQMEGLPVALIEAMASGVPVVSTRLSGIPELVADGETGLLAEPGDPVSLAEALVRTLADPAAALGRAKRGRQTVTAAFDVRASGARMAALFRSEGDRARGLGHRPVDEGSEPELELQQGP
jgi:glycosyltransferase involved in cell wall biosynthesis